MEDQRPVPKARKHVPAADTAARPVPKPRRLIAEPPSTREPDTPAVELRKNSPSVREYTNKFQGGKRMSRDFALLTRDTIEKGVMSVAKLAGRVVDQGVTTRRTPQSEYIPEIQRERPKLSLLDRSRSLHSDMDLFGTIRFDFPQPEEPNVLTNTDNNYVNTILTVPNNTELNANLNDGLTERSSYQHGVANNLYTNIDPNDPNGNAESNFYEDINPISSDPPICVRSKPTPSTIIEFDPLLRAPYMRESAKSTGELNVLEKLLGDSYNLTKVDDDISDEVEFEFNLDSTKFSQMSPPPPPERFDSLNESTDLPIDEPQPGCSKRSDDPKKTPPRKTSLKKDSFLSKSLSTMLKVVPDSASQIKKKFEMQSKVEKPPLSKNNVQYSGNLIRILADPMEELFQNYPMRPCSLTNQTITCHIDGKLSGSKETFNLDQLFSLQSISIEKIGSNVCVHCFQLNLECVNMFKNRMSVMFGCNSLSGRSNWILKIVESLSNVFPSKYIPCMKRFGWCFMKENVSREWSSGWMLLSQRYLFYHYSNDAQLHTLDLRKARFVVLRKDDDKNTLNAENGPNLILDFHDRTLYIKAVNAKETKIWRRAMYNSATENGIYLHQQQLTKENVPILVHKCINFIYSYGSLSEGIYRKVGSVQTVKTILDAFKKDAWNVQLSPRTHSEYDVASSLKQFFRSLPEPILEPNIHPQLFRATEIADKTEKVAAYDEILKGLNSIVQKTLRMLFGHLHFIQTLAHENKMTTENLAAIWSPTLLCQHEASQENFLRDGKIIQDLIDLYIPIYKPEKEELDREKLILDIIQKYQRNNSAIVPKPSGDFHIWIYLSQKSSETSVNVVLNPGKTARELCLEFSSKMKMSPEFLNVEEVICDDSMFRPIHHSECLLDVVLRWGYWNESDRKDNYLVITDNKIVRNAVAAINEMSQQKFFLGELKYANDKTQRFKTYTFHFIDGRLTCQKDKMASTIVDSWIVKDTFYYLGHEPKRNPMTTWSMTLVDRKQKYPRSKDKPWFGCTIAGNEKDELERIMGLFLYYEHPNSMMPSYLII